MGEAAYIKELGGALILSAHIPSCFTYLADFISSLAASMSQTDIILPTIDGVDSQHRSPSPSRLQQTPSRDQLLSSPMPGDTPTAREARQIRKIAQLEQKLETLEAGRVVKERYELQCLCNF
jgi:hypothetical protein